MEQIAPMSIEPGADPRKAWSDLEWKRKKVHGYLFVLKQLKHLNQSFIADIC